MNELTNEEIIKSEYYGNRTKSVVYLEDEQFTPIKNHPDYLISQYGRVFSTKCNKMLTNQVDKDGYLRVTVDGVNSGVHRLAAYTYLPEDSKYYGQDVNHINGRKHDNSPENLEWLSSPALNIDHAIKNDLRKGLYGENNHCARYTNEQVEKECQLLEKYPSLTSVEIAKLLGISNSDKFDREYSNHITKVRRKETFKNITSKYDLHPRDSRTKNRNKELTKRIEKECQLLNDGMSYEEIAKITGMECDYNYKHHLSSICSGKEYKDISSKYNIHKPNDYDEFKKDAH